MEFIFASLLERERKGTLYPEQIIASEVVDVTPAVQGQDNHEINSKWIWKLWTGCFAAEEVPRRTVKSDITINNGRPSAN
jgi:hypothetical protein